MTNSDANAMADKAPAVQDSTRHIFPFFDLPAELRDHVYDELLVTRRRAAEEDHLALKVENLVDPNASRISRQFRSEYLARAGKRPVIAQFTDHAHFYGFEEITLPRGVLRTNIAEVRVLELGVEEYTHPMWIEVLLDQFSGLREVHLKIATSLSSEELEVELQEYDVKATWLALNKLCSWKIYRRSEPDYKNFDFDEHAANDLMGTWNFEKECWEDVKAGKSE